MLRAPEVIGPCLYHDGIRSKPGPKGMAAAGFKGSKVQNTGFKDIEVFNSEILCDKTD